MTTTRATIQTALSPRAPVQATAASRATAQGLPRTSNSSVTFSSVESRADSLATLNALVLIAQREGDFLSLLKSLGEKRRESRTIQDEMLVLMSRMDPQLARRGAGLAGFLVEPPNLLLPAELQRVLKVILPFIETIPDTLPTFGAFCLAAGVILREHEKHALAGRYFERASRTHFPLAAHALYLAIESAGASHEADRLIELEKRLEEPNTPEYLRKEGRLTVGLALSVSGRDSLAREYLEGLSKTDLDARGWAKVTKALGQLYERRGEYERAARSYTQAFETGASSQEAIDASRAYLRLVRNSKISEDVSKTLSAARCLVRAGLRSEARPILEALFRRGRLRLEAGWDLASLHYRMKNYVEAEKVFRALEKLEKNATGSSRAAGSERALLGIGRCERQLSHVEAAIAIFRQAAFTGKRVTYSEAAWELALEFESLGRLREATETYEALYRQFPETLLGEEALWRKGFCEYKAGSIREAESTFASSLKDKRRNSGRDMRLFWMLKCSMEGGFPVSSMDLARQRPRSDSLYGLLLESVSKITRADSLRGERVGTGKPITKDIFKIPWVDLHLTEKDLADSGSKRRDSVTPDALRQSPSVSGELGLSEGLPPEAKRGALLLAFGLRDLALKELGVCERKFSGNNDVLFLMTQLYWRNDLYKQALSLADRLLKSDHGMSDRQKRFLGRILYPICYPDVLLAESRAQAVDPFLALAVIKKESTFDPKAVSPAGATGLMQLMPETARAIAAYLGEEKGKPDLRNPELNIRYGIWHLGRLVGRYSDSVVTALAAYNAGEDNAERWATSAGSNDGFVYMESVSYRETREYIRRVLTDLQMYREIYRH